nr:integrase, catalytic region, zinc finger, CCHC-type, peptidase aspartic, catalytic [Tanacetum cinerariifolium]
ATNIILQRLPPEVYALVSNHRIAKELWERIQLLMQGTSLMKQERESIERDVDDLLFNIVETDKVIHTVKTDIVKLMVEIKSFDPGIPGGQATQTVITHNSAYQADDLDAYNSDCEELNTAKVTLMANLSQYALDVLAEVHNPYDMDNNMINQGVLARPSSEQSSVVNYSETEIISDSNIILYSQYVHETQQSSMNSLNPNLSKRPTKVDVPKELPKVSMPLGNTKKDKIHQPPSSTPKNKVEAHPRTVKSSLKNKNCVVKPKGTAIVQHFKLNVNFKLICVKCNGCMLYDNHDLFVPNVINDVNTHAKFKSVKKNSKRKVWKLTGKVFTNIGYIWRPTGRTFTIVRNAYPLTRITTTTEVPSNKLIALETDTSKPVVTLVYSRKPRKCKTTDPVSKSKVVQIILWYLDFGCLKHMTGDRSQLTNFINKFLGFVKFRNDHVAKKIAMASKHSISKPALHGMTLAIISSGLVPGPSPSTPYVPPLRSDWHILFQPLFDELLTRPPSVDPLAPKVIALITEIVALESAASTGSPSSTTVDQDAPSPSNS